MREVTVSFIDLAKHTVERKKDLVAEETPLHIFVNQTRYVTILCLPTHLKELAVGHLLSEGVLKSVDEVQETRLGKAGRCQVRLRPEVDVEERVSIAQPFTRLVLSACGSLDYWSLSRIIDRLELRRLPLGFAVRAEVVSEGVRQLNKLAGVFRKTGGVHVAALYSRNGELIAYAEDVGRHNAVDKVVGIVALQRPSFSDCFLASSGRLTGDIVLKASRVGIPVVASLSAAVSSGVDAARCTGQTLIGFVRGTRMNVFTYPERVVFEANGLVETKS